MGLGDTERAIANSQSFETHFGRSRPGETAQVRFAIGSIYERQELWDHTVRWYRRYLREMGRRALPHHPVVGNTAIGRALWRQDERGQAATNFRDAAQAWERGAPRRILTMQGASDAERRRYLGEAQMAAAEALFYLGEYKYQDFKALSFPEYRGPRTASRVTRWAQGEFLAWVRRKIAALRTAEQAYSRILQLELEVDGVGTIPAPPAWQIAAAARIGQMYDEFAESFTDAPIPDFVDRDEELYGIYTAALDEQRAPLHETAIARYQFCLNNATQLRWFNEFSRICERELNRINAAEYPMSAELRGPTALTYRPGSEPGPEELGAGSDDDEETADAATNTGS